MATSVINAQEATTLFLLNNYNDTTNNNTTLFSSTSSIQDDDETFLMMSSSTPSSMSGSEALTPTTPDTPMMMMMMTTTQASEVTAAPGKIISDEAMFWAEVIGYVALNGTVSIFGIIANIINVIVFHRQGVLSDSSTISLLALALSDLASLITLFWSSILFALTHIRPPNLPFHIMDTFFLTGGRPHVMWVQVTSWFTVYIAFERCMCVVFPFRVKRLFTAQRSAVLLPCMAILITIGGYLPYYLGDYFIWEKVPDSNRSILVMYRTIYDNSSSYSAHVSAFLNIFVGNPTVLILVLLFTQITIFRVNLSSQWRQSTTAVKKSETRNEKTSSKTRKDDNDTKNASSDVSTQSGGGTSSKLKGTNDSNTPEIGSKEKRLVKMITTISIIFIICMTPNIIFNAIEEMIPGMGPGRRYNNFFYFNYAVSFFMEAVNSSINIFVYYRMSTRYRTEFRKLFGMDQDKSQRNSSSTGTSHY